LLPVLDGAGNWPVWSLKIFPLVLGGGVTQVVGAVIWPGAGLGEGKQEVIIAGEKLGVIGETSRRQCKQQEELVSATTFWVLFGWSVLGFGAFVGQGGDP
jgi:hypothetical protein